MNDPTLQSKVDRWSEWWRKLIAPVLACAVGLAGFAYELTTGHDATFGTLSLGLAAAGAGLSADILRRFS